MWATPNDVALRAKVCYNTFEVKKMIFYYIRHGDPTYKPNELTPLGRRQAETVAKRLALYGVDKIYASTSNRAMETAQPSCELMKTEAELLDFANEKYTSADMMVCYGKDAPRRWIFETPEVVSLFCSKEIRDLGDQWYDHPDFKDYAFKTCIQRIYDEADAFFLSLGYEHHRFTGKYKIVTPNEDRVALFAHQGFGLAFLSCMLDIPYPSFCTHFDMCHSGITVIEFQENGGYAVPRILTMSSDSHLYREGLPTRYNNRLYF